MKYSPILKKLIWSALVCLASIGNLIAKTPDDTLVIASYIDDLLTLEPAEIFEFTGAEYAANTYDRLIGYNINNIREITGVVAES